MDYRWTLLNFIVIFWHVDFIASLENHAMKVGIGKVGNSNNNDIQGEITQKSLQHALHSSKFLPTMAVDRQKLPEVSRLCDAYESQARGDSTTDVISCDCVRINEGAVVTMTCTDLQTTCNENDSICYQTVTTFEMLEILSPPDGLSTDVTRAVITNFDAEYNITQATTCTNFTNTTIDDEAAEVYGVLNPLGNEFCITVRPTLVDDFSQISDCSVTMNNETCFRCLPCGGKISFDCCNVEEDFRALCHDVASTGSVVPFFDVIGEEPGTCDYNTSGGGSSQQHIRWIQTIWIMGIVAIVTTAQSFF